MAEGRFLKFPGKKESNAFLRKEKEMSKEKFENITSDFEKRVVDKEQHPSFKLIQKYEVKKTPEQEEVVRVVIEKLDELLEKYEAKKQDLSTENILIEKDAFWREVGCDNAAGLNVPAIDKVFFRESNSKTSTRFASVICHELLHRSSFSRMLLARGKKDGFPDIKEERGGFSVFDPKENERHLSNLNEAITTELERRLMQEMKDHPLFRGDFWKIKKKVSRKEADRASALIEFEDDDEEGGKRYSTHTAYPEQRENMHRVVDEVYEKHKGDFESEEEVFDVFVKGYFSGKLLEVSRLLKSTYGKDKTIKEIAKEQGL